MISVLQITQTRICWHCAPTLPPCEQSSSQHHRFIQGFMTRPGYMIMCVYKVPVIWLNPYVFFSYTWKETKQGRTFQECHVQQLVNKMQLKLNWDGRKIVCRIKTILAILGDQLASDCSGYVCVMLPLKVLVCESNIKRKKENRRNCSGWVLQSITC